MDSLTVDVTYGQALFDAAGDCEKISEIGAEYKAVSAVFADQPALKKLFLIPTVSAGDKKAVAKKVFEGRVSRELLAFLCILIDKRRVGAWDGVGRCYEQLQDKRAGLTKGILYSVLPVEKGRLSAFEEKTGASLGKNVKLENRIDKSLIGGVKIYVDGKLIDASVKSRLESMKQKLMG
ncbi:MAG: ATP synthase F1 subunit delta [Clostridiales Family XIII bacterium]|jgi:ATP synthase F1 delta subunit|nr:ATP synthase F1 subunit delta [Clostridiales Family XIII bacterium]